MAKSIGIAKEQNTDAGVNRSSEKKLLLTFSGMKIFFVTYFLQFRHLLMFLLKFLQTVLLKLSYLQIMSNLARKRVSMYAINLLQANLVFKIKKSKRTQLKSTKMYLNKFTHITESAKLRASLIAVYQEQLSFMLSVIFYTLFAFHAC